MDKYFQKLELDIILEQLSDIAVIPDTKKKIADLSLSSDLDYLNNALDEVDEALGITNRLDRAPIMIATEYLNIIDIAYKEGILDGLDLYETVRLFTTIKANIKHLNFLLKEHIPCIYYEQYVNSLYVIDNLDETLKKSIDESGFVMDEASSLLKSLRNRLRQMDARIKSKIQEIIAKEGSKLSQTTISIRNDRYVLAVRAEYKNSFKGMLQDVSASSQTVFIEPMAVAELTNEKNTLIKEEKIEIERILHSLSKQIGENYEILKANFLTIVELDFIFAKAVLAKRQDANRPSINDKHIMNLVNARHPLLKVAKVIPNNVHFGNYLGIVITGPNTGGKTVLLKTVGLLSLMVKCGLLIPADATSNVMVYDQVCCDIGDDQSIQANLSTFSSHMHNIIGIINQVTPNSLVLFDEIGGGTDPSEGSNLAIAILNHLVKNQISFITTTHYSELKAFAYGHDKVVNASMEFNENTLSPTYKLVLGLSGASNAFNIAARLGLRKAIIEDAKQNLTTNNNDVRMLVEKLEKQSFELNEQIAKMKGEEENSKRIREEYQQKISTLEKEKCQILRKAEEDAKKMIDDITNDASRVLEEIKMLQSAKDVKLHEIIAAKKGLDDLDVVRPIEPVKPVVKRDIRLGDDVFLTTYGQYGQVIKVLKPGLYEVATGNIIMKMKKEQLEVVDKTPKEVDKDQRSASVRVLKTTRSSLSLDLRGERYEDAKEKLAKYFDDIILSGIKQVTIIHGYGTGTIRTLVQTYLKNNKNVESFRYGGAGEGGMGSTVVTMK